MNSNQRSMENDLVVTGYGAIAPLGNDVEKVYAGLIRGDSGIRLIVTDEGDNPMTWMAGIVNDFDPKEYVHPRKTIKVMCREIQMGFGASMQACKMAGITAGSIDPDRLGTVFSGEILFSETEDVESIVRLCATNGQMNHSRWAAEAMENMHPLWMLKSLPNMTACHVGIALDARGPNNTITSEATSGLGATLEAMNVIRRGMADVMIVGSSASRACFARLLQRHEEDYSKAYSNPASACKPFDSERDGTVSAECASAIVLERRSHAIARKAKILGSIVGSANLYVPSAHRWSGAQAATEKILALLLERSGLGVESIDHVNSAANGTVKLDSAQAFGIANVLGNVPVVSYKGGLGDSISGASLIELVSSIAGMCAGSIAPTTNHNRTGKDCPVDVISKSPKPRTRSTLIKLSNTHGGHCIGIAMSFEN